MASVQAPGRADLVTLNRAATVARLLAGVAHEVNNALQVIGGTTELLQDTPGLPEPVAKGFGRIGEQNVRAATTISNVLSFSRQKDVRGRVNLREIARQSAVLRAFSIGRAQLAITVDVPPDGRFAVEGSGMRLQLAVLNLIVNAEQALAGRRGGAIRLTLEEPGDVVLRVSDDGPGVDAGIAGRIFDPFFTTRPREEASGLGLAVARLIAEEHGGLLTLDGRGPGATFELRLPPAAG
jgi:two-component system NtrC family sensor kinase